MSMGFLGNMVVGNIELNAWLLRESLKKSHYWLTYRPEAHTIELWQNDGGGGVMLLRLSNTSHENAARMAEELGLKADNASAGSAPLSWSKWNPHVVLYHHSGDTRAEALRLEALKLGVPCKMKCGDYTLELSDGMAAYKSPAYTVEQMLGVIRGIAERYKELLATKP